MKKLKDWLPDEALAELTSRDAVTRYLDVEVRHEYANAWGEDEEGDMDQWGNTYNPSPFPAKFVNFWCVLQNGAAVAFNENPSRGWSFPVKHTYAKDFTKQPSQSLNEWFLSLGEGRQKILLEDKWMLANAAFEAGKVIAKKEMVKAVQG